VPFVPAPGSPLWERINSNSSASSSAASNSSGSSISNEMPRLEGGSSSVGISLLPEDAGLVNLKEFDEYVAMVYTYLQVCVCVCVCEIVCQGHVLVFSPPAQTCK